MNKAAFLNIVRQVAPIEDQEVEDLERLVVTFPYCQTAHVLLAKAAYDRGSMLSNQKLRKAAAHVSNRQLLKKLVYASPITEETTAHIADEAPVSEAYEQPEVLELETTVIEPFTGNEVESSNTYEEITLLYEEIASADITEPVSEEITALEPEPASEEIIVEVSYEEVVEPEAEQQEVAQEDDFILVSESSGHIIESSFIAEVEEQDTLSDLVEADLSPNSSIIPIESQTPSDIIEIAEENLTFETESVITEEVDITEVNSDTEIDTDSIAETTGSEEDSLTSAVEEVVAEVPTPSVEDELLDLIHIDSLSALTAPFPSVKLSRAEIVSNIVSTSETAFYNQEGKVSLEEVMALAAADRELEDLPQIEEKITPEQPASVEIPEDQLFPWETPGYQIPTLQYDLLHQAEIIEPTPASADAYTNILSQNSLGYWMDSSRMGESLQLRDELTPSTPFYFQPELILEHVKGNGKPEPELVPAQNNRLDQQLNIIDQFLKTSPKLKAIANSQWKDEPIEDLSAKSSKIKRSLASENLAQIYIKQGKGRKAVKIYEQLIVKYPEKKGYFAEQIEKLRNEP